MFAYVTLLLNNEYLPGTLTLCRSLKDTGSTVPIVLLFSKKNLNNSVYEILINSGYFERLINIDNDLIYTKKENMSELNGLLNRHDLLLTMTKLNIWKLTEYELVMYMDSDMLVRQNIDDLFTKYRDRLTEKDIVASSDSGWPDIFNSGLFIVKPSLTVFDQLLSFYWQTNSFDGADQGLLNEFFVLQEGYKWIRLPFVYNCTLNSNYEYLPAMVRFKNDIKVFHFIGFNKPWKNYGLCFDLQYSKIFDGKNLFGLWWTVFQKIMIGTYDAMKILEVSNNLQLRLDRLSLDDQKVRTVKAETVSTETELDQHEESDDENPFIPSRRLINSTVKSLSDFNFPTFYYKKPINSVINDESSKGEAYKLMETKIEWPETHLVKGPDDSDERKSTDDIGEGSFVEKYVNSTPIFPWESSRSNLGISRTFENSEKFEPPAYTISIRPAAQNNESNINTETDIIGFEDGQSFDNYLKKIESVNKLSLSHQRTASSTNSIKDLGKEMELDDELEKMKYDLYGPKKLSDH